MNQRSSIILRNDKDEIALIRRVKQGTLYYVFPGGRVEPGDSTEDTAVREAFEELGVTVVLNGVAAHVDYNGQDNPYFWATITGGVFGTGTGEEFTDPNEIGSYTPVWVHRSLLTQLPIRPPSLAKLLAEMQEPFYDLTIEEH